MKNKDNKAEPIGEFDESDAGDDLMSSFYAPVGQAAPLETVDDEQVIPKQTGTAD